MESGFGSASLPNSTAVLPPPEYMMSDFSVLEIPKGLSTTLENMHNSEPWISAVSDMRGLGVPPMTFSTLLSHPLLEKTTAHSWESAGNMLGHRMDGLTRSDFFPDWPPVAATVKAGLMEIDEKELMFTTDLLEEDKVASSWWVKVDFYDEIFKFPLGLPTMEGLKTQVLKRNSKLEADGLKFMYKDEDGEMITIACDEDLQFCFEYFKSSSSNKPSVRLSLVANVS